MAIANKQAAGKKFLKKDHSDSNMLVAIRIRPLDKREKGQKDFEIISTEDKLLVSRITISISLKYICLFIEMQGF